MPLLENLDKKIKFSLFLSCSALAAAGVCCVIVVLFAFDFAAGERKKIYVLDGDTPRVATLTEQDVQLLLEYFPSLKTLDAMQCKDYLALELLKAQKPVIVSMGSYAASGGYYISAPADAILSDRMTLTGSIGVFGMFMNPTKALQKNLGITMDGVKTNRSAGMGQREPLTAAERRAVMRGVDKVYERFTGLVSEGRNLPIEKVLEIAGGRVWSGSDALEIGLVDGLGGLKMALALAAEKADLGEEFQVVEKTEVPTGFAAVMSALSAKVKAEVSSTELEKVMEEYQHVKEALQQQGIVMYSPYRLELN